MSENDDQNRIMRRISLRGRAHAVSKDDAAYTWPEAMEWITQRGISLLFNHRERGELSLESTVFAKCLSETAREWKKKGVKNLPELMLFLKPVSLYSFQLHNRLYQCSQEAPSTEDAGKIGLKSMNAVRMLLREITSAAVNLEEKPTLNEILITLLDHIRESNKNGVETPKWERTTNLDWREIAVQKVHSARKGALRNWESRLWQQHRTDYEHKEEESFFYAYPYVDALAPDGMHLVLLFASPLDKNFIDEKVSYNNRAPGVTLALYDIKDMLLTRPVAEILPLIKHAFGRVLFTSMLQETDKALNESSEERASIMRHWAEVASDGVNGVMTKEQCNAPFDAFDFCEAIVRKVLCEGGAGVEKSEIYPFNRAFIFREAGTSSTISDEPIEVRVLEASILSNNPADRGRRLTARERKLRSTRDFECSPSDKQITDENIYRFHIHVGDQKNLILSRKRDLSREIKKKIIDDDCKSEIAREGEPAGYRITIPKQEEIEGRDLPTALYNLFGRLVQTSQEEKEIKNPFEKGKSYQVTTFKETFKRLRLEVLERFDERGLYFHHDYGLELKKEAPMLHQLQRAYFDHLNDYFQKQDIQYRREGYLQDNMNSFMIDEIEDSFHKWKKETRTKNGVKEDDGQFSPGARTRPRSKVVFISFSWELHDQNTRMFHKRKEGNGKKDRKGEDKQQVLLGKEYTYTLILVSDNDPVKSIARIQSERKDLLLFFQMIMRQIWMDKLNEYEYLVKRSQSITGSLHQFIHRVKNLIPDPKKRDEVHDFHTNLKVLMEPKRPTPKWRDASGPGDLFAMLLSEKPDGGMDENRFRDRLIERSKEHIDAVSMKARPVHIRVLPSPLPRLRVMWSSAVVRDAFSVSFKNAVEAAGGAADPGEGEIYVQLQAAPRDMELDREKWFLDIVIENTGGPIGSALLEQLNAADPAAVNKNLSKSASTGIGVFLSRFQLKEVIRMGADLILANLGDHMVQCRIRLPAKHIRPRREEISAGSGMKAPDRDYLLYVEDTEDIYTDVVEKLTKTLAEYDLKLAHAKSYMGAGSIVKDRPPLAVLTDLYILKNEEDDIAGMVNGLNFLDDFIRMACSGPLRPPIWIFTNEDEPGVRQSLKENITFREYDFPSSEDGDKIKPETIRIFANEKRPDKLEDQLEGDLLKTLLNWCDSNRTANGGESTQPMRSLESIPGGRVVHLKNGFFDDAFYNSDYLEPLPRDGVVQVRSDRVGLPGLIQNLSAWFAHPGFPDPDFAGRRNRGLRRLTNHVAHKRIVLAVPVEEQPYSQLPVVFFYWGLSRNIWLHPAGGAPANLSRIWVEIRQEDRGPLSNMRHDLNNEWTKPGLPPLLSEAVEAITQCEKTLTPPAETLLEFEKKLLDGSATEKCITDHFMGVEEVEKSRKEAGRRLRSIADILRQGDNLESSVRESVAKQRKMLQNLEDYLGGPQ